MEHQKVLSLLRQAIEDYNMISEGDRIAVGLSGGKDSIALLTSMSLLSKFYPKHFDLCAITIDIGFGNMNYDILQNYCSQISVPLYIEHTQIKDIVFDIRKESNPCSLCAKLRRGALNQKALEIGARKVAYAHHKDDFESTFMMSLFYEGRIQSIEPKTFLDQTTITVIRPFMYLTENQIKSYVKQYDFPVIKNTCPADGTTKRKEMEDLLSRLNKEYPGVKEKIFTAIKGLY